MDFRRKATGQQLRIRLEPQQVHVIHQFRRDPESAHRYRMDKETELAIVRKAYSRQILAAAGVRDPAVEAAFAHVPREHYLGPGPWMTFRTPAFQGRAAGARGLAGA